MNRHQILPLATHGTLRVQACRLLAQARREQAERELRWQQARCRAAIARTTAAGVVAWVLLLVLTVVAA
jgi:hypothetical protein